MQQVLQLMILVRCAFTPVLTSITGSACTLMWETLSDTRIDTYYPTSKSAEVILHVSTVLSICSSPHEHARKAGIT